MKYRTIFILLLFFTTFQQIEAKKTSNSINNVCENAIEGLPAYLELIPIGQEELFGFNNRAEFEQIRIGIPIQLYKFSGELKDLKKNAKNKDFLIKLNIWDVPLEINNKPRCLLRIVENNDSCLQIVSIGSNIIANEIYEISKGYLIEGKSKISLLNVFEFNSSFLVIENQNNGDKNYGEMLFSPFSDAKRNLHKNDTFDPYNKKNYNRDELISIVERESMMKRDNKLLD